MSITRRLLSRHDLRKLLLVTSIVVQTLFGCRASIREKPTITPVVEPSARGATSPIEDYRNARYLDAIRGLTFDNGFVGLAADWQQVLAERASGEDLQTILERGADRFNKNMVIEALEAYTVAVLVDPAAPAAFEGLGFALVAKGKSNEGIAAFRTALRLDPNLINARYALASAHWMKGDLQEAVENWRQLLLMVPDHVNTHERLGIALYYLGDYQES